MQIVSLIYFIISFIILIFCIGYKEGMIMLQDENPGDKNPGNSEGGVKEHKSFDKLYHTFESHKVFWSYTGMFLFTWYKGFLLVNNLYFIPFIISLLILANEIFELAYSKSRYEILIPNYERFHILELYTKLINGKIKVLTIHIIRIILFVSFLIISII